MGKLIFTCILLIGVASVKAQTPDTLKSVSNPAVNSTIKMESRVERNHTKIIPKQIFGEYTVTSYHILGDPKLTTIDFNTLSGSTIKLDSTGISGDSIPSILFTIYEIEQLKKDDYLYRIHGSDIENQPLDLTESFKVHKTDNPRCYGIAEPRVGELIIPYEGALLYLTKK